MLSEAVSGTFDWTTRCVDFVANTSPLDVACRLGFYGSTAKGKLLVRRVQARAPEVAQCILAVAGASLLRNAPQCARQRGATLWA